MATHYSTRLIPDSPVLYVDGANIKSNTLPTTITDLSTNAVAVTLQNSGAATVVNTSKYFNFAAIDAAGVAGYYLINNATISGLTVNLTFETCVYVNTFYTSSGATQARPVSPRITEGSSPYGFSLSAGNISAEINAGGTWYTGGASNAAISTGVWVYVTQVTNDQAKTLTTYVNGISVNTVTYIGAPASGGGMLIGRGYYSGTLNYAGRVSFVRLYSRSLNANEVLQNFNAMRGKYSL